MPEADAPGNGRLPVVGITCNLRTDGPVPHHGSGSRYLRATLEVAGCLPVLIPAMGPGLCLDTLLATVDGLLLTGGASNIEPHHYGQEPAPGEDVRDPGRDALVLPLVRRAIELGVPLLGICRGIQEINVALGGTLHQRLHEVPGRMDHRRPREKPWEEQLAPRQRIRITPSGLLHALTGLEEAWVNSLHGQGLDRVADALVVEAVADDGTVEAVSAPEAPGWLLGVQWHAEHDTGEHPVYRSIFEAFGAAVRSRRVRRRAGSGEASRHGAHLHLATEAGAGAP